MARRGFGGTALRAALGAVTGVAEGMRLREEREFERKKTEEAARQAQQMSIANLMLQGFEAPAITMPRQQGARQAAGSAIVSALQAASGQMPTPITGDLKALGEGYATARPDRTVTIGGQTLMLRETAPEREQRLAQTKTMQADQDFENAVAQLPPNLQAAARASRVLPPNVLQALYQPRQDGMTEYQRAMIGLRERELGMRAQEKAAGGPTPASEIEKRLPVGARNDIADYNAAIRTLQEAQKEVANNPDAFGLMPAMYAKGGALGRSLRERSEGPQSEAYTKARAQMQSALMKLRKTQFGTQMTRLEKETGEEVFPSGAESPQRLGQMLTVLVGNAEQLRRGVYEANNAADLYQPIAPAETAPPVRPSPAQPATPAAQKLEQEFPDKAAQIQRARASGYTDAQIRARLIGGR